IVAGIPRSTHSYVHVVRQDPVRKGLLYAGTENALYVSFDDGESWKPLQTNLPHAPVYWLVVQPRFNDLVVSTYGRGFWVLDDVTPLQQLTPEVQAKDAHLFAPRDAWRFRSITAPASPTDDPADGENPPYGASINYWLKGTPQSVSVQILDGAGQLVRTLAGPKQAGLNRVWWDLRSEPSREARLRTSPRWAPEVRVGPQGWRAAPGIGRISILQPPGTYTVKLIVDGREQTQPLVVRKDPNSGGSEGAIVQQTALLVDVRTSLDDAVDMLNTIEVVRAQLQSLGTVLSADRSKADLKAAADSLEAKFVGVEDGLHQLAVTGRGQDGVRWPDKLAEKIDYLAGGIASTDEAPTTQAREAEKLFQGELVEHRARLDALLKTELPAFNELLRRRNVQNVVTDQI
ncbi:MAG TPA: hypothetical protein VFQ38_23650, partial [Longimicrobiales bacterium]|nr:hypothetical protein [Longimicrobiales bacterium]